MLTLTPYLALAVLAVALLAMRPGRDLAVVAFALPWFAVEVHLGIGLKVNEALMLLAVANYAAFARFRPLQLAGLPIVITFESGAPMVDPEENLVVPIQSATAIADADLRERCGRQAMAKIASGYDWASDGRSVRKLYEHLITDPATT
jgi:hypothetical protein